jgi:hypothetical protein
VPFCWLRCPQMRPDARMLSGEGLGMGKEKGGACCHHMLAPVKEREGNSPSSVSR